MLRVADARPVGLLLSGTTFLAAVGLAMSTPATAQTAPTPGPGPDIQVEGRSTPSAEAPSSVFCEHMVRDPLNRGLVALFPEFEQRRLRVPREPDYTKPPSVPAGSPLPQLGKMRFGAETGRGAQADERFARYCNPNYSSQWGNNTADIDNSASLINPPEGMAIVNFNTMRQNTEARFFAASRRMGRNDTTLPMAFALFDQGRYAESFDWFKKASAKLSSSEAALFVGKLHLQGLGKKSSNAEAIKWLKKAASAPDKSLGSPFYNPKRPKLITASGEAAIILGDMYRNGVGGQGKSPREAYRWYKRAFEVGYVPAAKTLGDMAMEGIGIKRKSPAAAFAWYEKAAKLGLSSGQLAAADLLYSGAEGVQRDRHMALGWYRMAAAADEPDALYALGHAFEFGVGVAPDVGKALGFYKTAALKGSAEAATALGTYFHQGKQVTRDEAVARQWFAFAATKADTDGMYNLGAMMANGQGGDRDLLGAWKWLRTAWLRGNGQAQVALAAVERAMTERQLQEVRSVTAKQ